MLYSGSKCILSPHHCMVKASSWRLSNVIQKNHNTFCLSFCKFRRKATYFPMSSLFIFRGKGLDYSADKYQLIAYYIFGLYSGNEILFPADPSITKTRWIIIHRYFYKNIHNIICRRKYGFFFIRTPYKKYCYIALWCIYYTPP